MMKNFSMKRLFLCFITLIFAISLTQQVANSEMLTGGINTNEVKRNFCTVIDKSTRKPVPNAKVTVPSNGFSAYTDVNGHFELKTIITKPTILSVEKQNYKPFSMTINRSGFSFVIEIEASSPFDISLETQMCHLGDDNYSEASASASRFRGRSIGSVFSKTFFIGKPANNGDQYLVFGSIIGIDTALARGMGQNHITTSFASPPSVYLNGQKIAEIQINGDNQKIRLPKQLIKYNQNNTITIKAGRNLMQRAYVDYDDFEFMNLSIQSVNPSYGTVSKRY